MIGNIVHNVYYRHLLLHAGWDEEDAQNVILKLQFLERDERLRCLINIKRGDKSQLLDYDRRNCVKKVETLSRMELFELRDWADFSLGFSNSTDIKLSVVTVVAKLIRSFGYSDKIRFSFSGISLYSDDGVEVSLTNLLPVGLKLFQAEMLSSFSIQDSVKDLKIMAEIFDLSDAEVLRFTKTNTAVGGVCVRDFRCSIASCLAFPSGPDEMAVAQRCLVSGDLNLPLFISAFDNTGGKITVVSRKYQPMNCRALECIGFDYYRLLSARAKLKSISFSLGGEVVDTWFGMSAYKLLLKKMVDNDIMVGDVFYLASDWMDRYVDSDYLTLLTYCTFKYVGASANLWNWVATVQQEVQYTDDEIFLIMRLIPKVYRLCVLFGLRTNAWEGSSRDYLSSILSHYGLSKKVDFIYDILGHMLDFICEDVDIPIPDLEGEDYFVTMLWSEDDYKERFNYNDNSFVISEEIRDKVFIEVSDNVTLDAGGEVLVDKEPDFMEVDDIPIEVYSDPPLVDDDVCMEDEEVDQLLELRCDDNIECFYVIDKSAIDRLRNFRWTKLSLYQFIKNYCEIIDSEDEFLFDVDGGYLSGVSSVSLLENYLKLDFLKGGKKYYKYLIKFKGLVGMLVIWNSNEIVDIRSSINESLDLRNSVSSIGINGDVVASCDYCDELSDDNDLLDIEDLDLLFNGDVHWDLVPRLRDQVKFKEKG